ncbi:MAG: hypothetical protein ACPIA1_06355 [Flavobacteriaceae bacterium]
MKYLYLLSLLFLYCSQNNMPEEKTFSFIGTWEYTDKVYLFDQTPTQVRTEGKGCNPKLQFVFRPSEFTLQLFQDFACRQAAEVVLSYTLVQQNDSVYRFTSDRLLRSNFQQTNQHDLSDLPLFDGAVNLIRRGNDEFVTYLPLEANPTHNGRPYRSAYISYRRKN